MTWLSSILIALFTGMLSLLLTGCICSACVNWYRISRFEGGAGYFVVFTALFGGIVGMVLGLITSRIVAASAAPGLLKGFAVAGGTVLGIAGIALLLCYLLADIPPELEGLPLDLEVELRLPAGATNVPPVSDVKTAVILGSIVNHVQRKSESGELNFAAARLENGRWIIPGSVFLFTRRGLRSISFDLGEKARDGFIIPLPSRPGKKFQNWSEWGPRRLNGTEPWPDSKSSYRFRVVRRLPPPPPPDPAVVEAEKFSALKPDAPLAEWLAFFEYDAPEERSQAIMQLVQARPAELVELIRSTNSATRERALSAVVKLTAVTPEVSEAVLAEGRDLATAIRTFNEMKSDDARFYDVQIELRTRFSYWHHAWWTVHQRTGVDGRPPVQALLDLALVRAQGTSMDEIVINAKAHLGGLQPAAAATP